MHVGRATDTRGRLLGHGNIGCRRCCCRGGCHSRGNLCGRVAEGPQEVDGVGIDGAIAGFLDGHDEPFCGGRDTVRHGGIDFFPSKLRVQSLAKTFVFVLQVISGLLKVLGQRLLAETTSFRVFAIAVAGDDEGGGGRERAGK